MGTARFSMLLGGACALGLGPRFKFRVLPFLKGDTIMSVGRPMPTEEFAEFGARWFYIFGSACVLGSLIWWAIGARKKKA